MQIAKHTIVGLICLPAIVVLAFGLSLVGIAFFVLYLIAAIAYPQEAEWSA